jgi:IQ calmodulin-binding motif
MLVLAVQDAAGAHNCAQKNTILGLKTCSRHGNLCNLVDPLLCDADAMEQLSSRIGQLATDDDLAKQRAATSIQKHFRGHVVRKAYKLYRCSACQSYVCCVCCALVSGRLVEASWVIEAAGCTWCWMWRLHCAPTWTLGGYQAASCMRKRNHSPFRPLPQNWRHSL